MKKKADIYHGLSKSEKHYVETALKISRYIHDHCENVPHGIGMDVMKIVEKSEGWMKE